MKAVLVSAAATAALFFLAACEPRDPGSPSGALPDVKIPYERFVLPNGLTVIVHEDHKTPVVAVNIWYHVGSKDERPGRTGFAHLFEHLMFNGSENHNDEWFRPLRSAGATKMNGTTWLDRTTYFQNVPTSAVDLALWMESDRMGHLLGVIDQKKLDEQRGVVQNEKRQGQNRPYGKVGEVIAANTYPASHPYSWTTIGSMADLEAASLDDVREWFRTYYGAANAVLVVAGDITTADAKQKVERYFGDIPPGPVIQRQQQWISKMSGERRALLQDRVPQARIYKTWNVPGYSQQDSTLLELAADVLASGKNSRLYKRLVYQEQLATAVEASVGPFEIGSQFQIVVTVKRGVNAAVVEPILDQEVARLLKNGVTRKELDRIRMARFADFVRSSERVDGGQGKSAILAESEVYGGYPGFYSTRLEWLRAATPHDVWHAAQRWLADGVFVLNVEPFPEYRMAQAGADRTLLPATSTPPALHLPPLERATLANGLSVVVVERSGTPIVNFSLLLDAGYAADSLAKPGTAMLALSMLDEGTTMRSALEIAAQADQLGARIGTGSTLDSSFVSLNALTRTLNDAFALFSHVLLNPSFPDEEIERQRSQMLAAIQQEKTDPRGSAARLLPQLVYGEGHAYSNPSSGNGTESSVNGLTRADLIAFRDQWIRPDNATLLVVGDTTLDDVLPIVKRHLGVWKAPSAPRPTKPLATVELPDRVRVFLVNRTGAEQSLVVAAAPAPSRNDAQHIAFKTLNTILGDGFISRLNLNLREDKHWAYGAGSAITDAQGQGMFRASASVQTDKTAESMREIDRELRDIVARRSPTAAEIKFARDALTLTLPGSNETASELSNSYADLLIFGLPDSYWNDYVGEVNGLESADLENAARRLIQPNALTWLVIGDLEKIEPGIRKLAHDLKWNDVRVLDPDGKLLR